MNIGSSMKGNPLQPTIKSIVTSVAEQQFVEVVSEQKCNALLTTSHFN